MIFIQTPFWIMKIKYLTKAIWEGKFIVYFIMRGHSSKNMSLMITLLPKSRSKEWWMLASCWLCPFYSVWDTAYRMALPLFCGLHNYDSLISRQQCYSHLQISVEVPDSSRNRFTACLSYVTPGYIPTGLYILPQRDFFIHVRCFAIHNSREWKQSKCPSTYEWIIRCGAYIYNEILVTSTEK